MATKIKDLRELLVHKMKDLLDVENRIVDALPDMIEAAENERLREALQEHLEQTKGHIDRLKQGFEHVDAAARRVTCKGMEGILEEGEEAVEKTTGEARDAAIIAAAQSVEHYEIAGYGTARTYAQRLKLKPLAELLQQTLDEEGEADKLLTEIATGGVNEAAAA